MRTSGLILSVALVVGTFASPVKRDLETAVEYEVGFPVAAGHIQESLGADIVKRATTYTNKPSSTSIKRITYTSIKKTTSTMRSSSVKKVTSTSIKKITSTMKASSIKKSSTAKGTPISTKQLIISSSPVSSTIKTSSTQKSSALPAKATTYQQRVLVAHNVHRANHSASNLVWDNALASTAAKIASTCVYAHNTTTDGGGYGQNIAAGLAADNVTAIITELFYNNEVPYFNGLYGQAQPNMSTFGSWGHFSQIVWKSTTKVGCATQYCPNGLDNVGPYVPPQFTVCNYGPPGNYGGEYADNIGTSLNRPTVHWDYGL